MAARAVLREVDDPRPAEQRDRRELARRRHLRYQLVGLALDDGVGKRAVGVFVGVGDQPTPHQEIEIEIAHDIRRILGSRGRERAMHFVERPREHRRETSPLEGLDHRVVRGEDRMDDRVRRDVQRQLRLEDLVVAVRVARDLEARRRREPRAIDRGELRRLELEPPEDRVEVLRPRLVIPHRAGRRGRRRLRLQDLGLLAREVVVGDGARVLRRRQPLVVRVRLAIVLLGPIAAACGIGEGRSRRRHGLSGCGHLRQRQRAGQGEQDRGETHAEIMPHPAEGRPERTECPASKDERSSLMRLDPAWHLSGR